MSERKSICKICGSQYRLRKNLNTYQTRHYTGPYAGRHSSSGDSPDRRRHDSCSRGDSHVPDTESNARRKAKRKDGDA